MKRAAPYDKILGAMPEMRAQTVDFVQEAIKQRVPAYVLVNNRTEGNAPLTIQALTDQLRQGDEGELCHETHHPGS